MHITVKFGMFNLSKGCGRVLQPLSFKHTKFHILYNSHFGGRSHPNLGPVHEERIVEGGEVLKPFNNRPLIIPMLQGYVISEMKEI